MAISFTCTVWIKIKVMRAYTAITSYIVTMRQMMVTVYISYVYDTYVYCMKDGSSS